MGVCIQAFLKYFVDQLLASWRTPPIYKSWPP